MRTVPSAPRPHQKAIPWLLAGDPAIRWQTLRDLVGAAEPRLAREGDKLPATDGGSPAGPAGPRRDVGRGTVLRWRALLAQVDLDDLHDADAP